MTIFLILISILSQYVFANDGIKEIEIPNYQPNTIVKSPIDDTIWIIDQNKPSYEYNYKTDELSALSDKFGDFADGLKDLILEDEYDPDFVWLGNFHKGVLCYRKSSKDYSIFSQTEYFNNEAISIIKPSEERVWIGTSKNLYFYDRENKQIFKSKFSKNIWIKNIRKENDNLIINNIYAYNLSNNSITKINEVFNYKFPKHSEFLEYDNIFFFKDYDNMKSIFLGEGNEPYIFNYGISYWFMIVENYKVYFSKNGNLAILDLKKRKLETIKIGSLFNLYNDKKVIWFFDKFGLGKIDKASYKIEKSNFSFPIIRSFLANDEYVWIGTDNLVVQIEKSHLEKVLKPKEQVEQNERIIEAKIKEFESSKDPIEIANAYFEIKNITDSKKIIKSLELRFIYSFVIRDSSDIKRFEEILEKSDNPKMKEAVCFGLICGYSLNGDPQKALEHHTKLFYLNSTSLFLEYVSEKDLTRLEKAAKKLKSLEIKETAEAEKLYNLGKIYYEMFLLSWNYGEVGINTEFPYKFYKELLDKYPESKWADNAEYEMLRYHQICSQEGGDMGSNLRYIEKYYEFLSRYPDTDLELLVKCNISSLYYSLMRGAGKGSLLPIDIEYLAKADSLLKQIPENYTEYDHIDYLRNGITEDFAKYKWKFKMQLESTTFTQEDNIHISFSIKNRNDTPQQITLKMENGIPNFGIYINKKRFDNKYRVKVPFIEDREINDLEEITYLVDVDEIYTEDWDITQKIKINHNKAIGHYEFLEKGLYQIKGYFVLERNMTLLTDPVIIKIE